MSITNYRAKKIGGSYQAEGTIVSTFATLAGETRHVFEFDQPAGMLHIFGPGQVEIAASVAAPQVVADERAAFEAKHAGRFDMRRDSGNPERYFTHSTNWVWDSWQARGALAAAPVQAQDPRKPTDISQRLREWADERAIAAHYGDLMRAAADEIERYYGGMLNWKAIAEAKDRAPVQPVAVPDDWRDKLVGLTVSIDVSTGEENGGNRIFGEVEEVMDDGDALVILAVESSRNFAAPAAQGDAIAYDELFDVVRGTGYVTSGQAGEICEKLIAAIAAKAAS